VAAAVEIEGKAPAPAPAPLPRVGARGGTLGQQMLLGFSSWASTNVALIGTASALFLWSQAHAVCGQSQTRRTALQSDQNCYSAYS
jgi:hypothetical protein